MTEQELIERRRTKLRVNGNPIRTLEEAREFIDEVGFCLMYPVRPPKLVPTFFGATVGSDTNLPLPQQAFNDPRASTATELMIRLYGTSMHSRPVRLARTRSSSPPPFFPTFTRP